jgi:hypothetical protein
VVRTAFSHVICCSELLRRFSQTIWEQMGIEGTDAGLTTCYDGTKKGEEKVPMILAYVTMYFTQ